MAPLRLDRVLASLLNPIQAKDQPQIFALLRSSCKVDSANTAQRHVRPQWAKRLPMTGGRLTGLDAVRIGLVLDAVAPAELDAAAIDAGDDFPLTLPAVFREHCAQRGRALPPGEALSR